MKLLQKFDTTFFETQCIFVSGIVTLPDLLCLVNKDFQCQETSRARRSRGREFMEMFHSDAFLSVL